MAADDDLSIGTREPRHRLRQRFEVIRKLGHGTYGKVQLAVNKETGQEVAIKTIKKAKIENGQDLVRIRREIQIMSYVQHPHIIHIHEVFENKEKIVLVMQYASGGELYDYLKTRRGASEADSRRIFRQIVSAVYYCHKNKICHRDLKLENILLDERGNAKIADFGLSNVFSDDKFLHTFCGSPLYASPEIVKGKPYYGPEVDCWSLGVLLYTLIYGAMPFDGSNFRSLVRQISEGDYYEPKRKSDASGLIQHLLTVKPAKRATVADICEHWWVNLGYEHSLTQVAEDMANFSPINVDAFLNLPQTNRNEQCKSPRKQDSSRSANSPITGQSSSSQEINESKAAKLATNCHLNCTNYDVVNSDSVSCSDDSLVINSIGPSKDIGVESNIFPNDCFHSVPDKNAVSKFGAKFSGKGLSTNNQDKKKHIPQAESSIIANKLSTTEEISSTKKTLVTDERLCNSEILNKFSTKESKVTRHKENTDVIASQESYRKEPSVGMCEVDLTSGEKVEQLRQPSSTEKSFMPKQFKNKACEKKIIASSNDEHASQRHAQASPSKNNPLSHDENKSLKVFQRNANSTKVSDNSISIHVEKSKLSEGKSIDQLAVKNEITVKTIKSTDNCVAEGNIQSLEKTTLSRDNHLSPYKNNEPYEVCEGSSSTLKSSDSSISTCVNKSIPDEEKLTKEEIKVKKNETKEEKITEETKDCQDDKKAPCKKGPGKLVIPKFFEAAQVVEKAVDSKKISKPLWGISDAKKAFENKPQEKKPIYIPTRRVSDARSKFEQKIESNHVSTFSTLPRRASKHSNSLKEDLSTCSLSSQKSAQTCSSEPDANSLKNKSESDMPKSSYTQSSCEESNNMQAHQLPEKESKLKTETSNDQAKKTSVKHDINEISSIDGNQIATDNPNKKLSAVSSFCEDKSSGSQNKTDISEKEALETVTEVSSSSVDLESTPITQNHNSSIRPSEQNSSTEEAKQVICQTKNVIDEMEEQQHKCNFNEGTTSVIQTLPYDNTETSKENKNLESNLSDNAQEVKITTSDSLTDKQDRSDKGKIISSDYHKEQTEEDNVNNIQTISNDSGNCSDNEICPPSKAQTIHDQSSGYISENQSLVGGEEQDVNEGTKLDLLKTFMEQECYPLNALLQNGYDHTQETPHQTCQQPFSKTTPMNNEKELGVNNLPLQTRKSNQPRRRHSDAQTTLGLRDISDLPESCYNDMLRFLNSQDTIRPKSSAPSVFSKHRHTRHITNKDHQERIQHWIKSEQRNGHSTDKDSSDNDDDFDIHLEYSYPAASVSNVYENINNVEDTLAPIQYSTQLPTASRPISHTGYRFSDEFSSVGSYKSSALSNEEIENLIGIPSRNMNYIRRPSHIMRYKDPFHTDITSRYIQNPVFQPLLPGCYHSNILHDHLKTRPNVAELYGTLRRRSSCKSDILDFPGQRDGFYPSSSISRKSLHSKQSSNFGSDTSNTERIRRNYTRSLSLDIPDVPQHSARINYETNLQMHIPQDYTLHSVQKQTPNSLHLEKDHQAFENNVTSNYQTCTNNSPNQNHTINSEPNQKLGGEMKICEDIMQHEINKLETDVKDICGLRKLSGSVELMEKSERSLLQQAKHDGHVGSISDQNLSAYNRQPENITLLSSVQTEPIAHKSTSLSLLEALKMQGYRNVIAQNMNFGSSATDSTSFDKSRTINKQEHLRNLQNCEGQERYVEQKTVNDSSSLSTEHPNLTIEFPSYENPTFQQSNSKQQLSTVRESNESLSCKFESDQEESVSERIWRKSFYSRFNDSLAKRRKSYREGDLKTQSISGSNWDILMEDNFKEDVLSRRRSSLTLGSSYSSTLPRSGIKPITKQRSCGSEVSDPLLQINDSSMIHKSSYRQKCNKNNRASSLEIVESVSEDSSSFPVQRPTHIISTDRDLLYTTSVAESSYNRLYGTLKSSAYNSNSRQILSQLREAEDCRSGKNTGGILPRRRYSTFDGYLYAQKPPTLTEPVTSILDSTKAENDEFS